MVDVVAHAPVPVRWLIVAAEPVTSVDVTASDMLGELHDTLQKSGVRLCFAELKDPVKDKFKRFDLLRRIGHDFFFPTIAAAVNSFIQNKSDAYSQVGQIVSHPARRPAADRGI